jgi:hypothetical protein
MLLVSQFNCVNPASNHARRPRLPLVARWTKCIPDGSTTQLKRVPMSKVSGIYGRLARYVYPFHAHMPKSHVQRPRLSHISFQGI